MVRWRSMPLSCKAQDSNYVVFRKQPLEQMNGCLHCDYPRITVDKKSQQCRKGKQRGYWYF